MQIDFTQTLHDLDGKPIAKELHEDGSVKTPATLGSVAIQAIMSPKIVEGEPRPASGEEALRAIGLGLTIRSATGPVAISAEDVVYIKERIAATYTAPLVVGRAWQMLEGA